MLVIHLQKHESWKKQVYAAAERTHKRNLNFGIYIPTDSYEYSDWNVTSFTYVGSSVTEQNSIAGERYRAYSTLHYNSSTDC